MHEYPPPRGKLAKITPVRLDDAQRARLDALAREQGVSPSEALRRLIEAAEFRGPR